MADAVYHFISNWKVKSTKEEVYDVLGDAEGLARWWPSVYPDVKILQPGDELGVGKLSSAEGTQFPANAGALDAAEGCSRIRTDKVVDEYCAGLYLRSDGIGVGCIFAEHGRA